MSTLVAFFSASGVTEKRAKELAKAADADLYEIEPAQPYTRADLNWNDANSRSSRENNDASARPALAGAPVDVAGYDRIYLGFPIWWGIAPKPVNTFIEQNDLTGKRIYVFATSGGSGVNAAVNDLRATYPQLDFETGALANGRVRSDIFA
ncbi:MAG: flavodoxin [Eggerthellaceae bacterium]|jgi:putative NADPH-quinone reductase